VLERMLNMTLDSQQGFVYATPTKPNFTSGKLQVECVVESLAVGGGAYIGAERSLHRLGKVSLEQMDGWPAIHVAGWPLLSASTTSKPQILPCEPM
jgi:hypothetical protein